MLLWLMSILWLPILTLVLMLVQPFAVCVPAKIPLPTVGN